MQPQTTRAFLRRGGRRFGAGFRHGTTGYPIPAHVCFRAYPIFPSFSRGPFSPGFPATPEKRKSPVKQGFSFKWSGGESNSRPHHCERCALPAELPPRAGRSVCPRQGVCLRGGRGDVDGLSEEARVETRAPRAGWHWTGLGLEPLPIRSGLPFLCLAAPLRRFASRHVRGPGAAYYCECIRV